MTRKRGPSRRDRVEAAYRILDGLLRSPKTRAGLIAAVAPDMSKNFCFGYLAERVRSGKVTVLKACDPLQYVMSEFIVIERPRPSDFPAWLDPRGIPIGTQRHVYIDGKLVQQHSIRDE